MSKSLVVIVDTNEKKLMPLLARIIDELPYELQLEVITEKEYLNNYFQVYRKIDLLIIAESDYQINFGEHSIGKVVILGENIQSGGKNENENVVYIYRYSKISTSVNAILSFLPKNTGILKEEISKTKVIVVTSSSGGEGKTLLALSLTKNLINAHKKALYINVDWIQNFDIYMQDAKHLSVEEMFQLVSVGSDNIEDLKMFIQENNGVRYLQGSTITLESFSKTLQWYVELIKKIVKTKEYEYLIVDTNTCLDQTKLGLVSICDKLVVITKDEENMEKRLNRLIANLSISMDKCLFVRNIPRENKAPIWLITGEQIKFTAEIMKSEEEKKYMLEEISKQSGSQSVTYMII